MNQRSLWAAIGICLCVTSTSLCEDEILEHPLLPTHDAVVTIDAKTTATVLEIMPHSFARQVKGTKVEVHTTRGWGWIERKQLMTPKDADKYCQAHNKEPYGLYLQSTVHMMNGRQDKALADLNAAIKLDPKYGPAYYTRGNVHAEKGEHQKALNDFLEAVKLNPKDLIAANDLAWFRATCSQDKFRDGKLALAEATRICEATEFKHEEFLDTLAAASAEVGDFKAAVKWASKALSLDPENEDFQEHVKLYKANKPRRE